MRTGTAVRFLIFGRGRVVRERYLPFLEEVLERSALDRRLEVTFVEVPDGIDAEDRERDLQEQIAQARPEHIDKILVLSPPQMHLENLRSVVGAYAAAGLGIPEIFVEKPLYLHGERQAWEALLAERPLLEKTAFYIDHYRYKAPVASLEREKTALLTRLGPLQELAWISLEAQPFWDSVAFAEGYLLEHGCHFVSMLRQVFEGPGAGRGEPSQSGLRLVPTRLAEWRAWVQRGRPASCKKDSAVLMYLSGPPGSLLEGVTVTVAMGKGMSDKKFLQLWGDRGSCTMWFNEGRFVLQTAQGKEERRVPVPDSYRAIVWDILDEGSRRERLLSLRDGIREQEAVVEVSAYLPQEGEWKSYEPGEIPPELAGELMRLGAWM